MCGFMLKPDGSTSIRFCKEAALGLSTPNLIRMALATGVYELGFGNTADWIIQGAAKIVTNTEWYPVRDPGMLSGQ
jgi:hypothetical protein